MGTTWVEVCGERLRGNFAELRRAAGMPVLAVIKADAYGHGAELCAPVLARAGAAWMGVTDAAEGERVRGALEAAGSGGDRTPGLLVMCGALPEDADRMVGAGLTPVVWTVGQMEALAGAVRRAGGIAGGRAAMGVHVEVDTGMSRQGVREGAGLAAVLGWLRQCAELRMDGVMTHFASAEVVGSRQTAEQRGRFEVAVGQVGAEGLRPGWVHAGNTSAVDGAGAGSGHGAWLRGLAEGMGAGAMVRSGLGLYGYRLPLEEEVGGEVEATGLRLAAGAEGVRPVMTWRTQVIGVSEVEAGGRVGYNGTFVARGRMRLALLPVGYADGFRRELSSGDGGGWVMVRGQRAAVVGRVSMNLTTVDVTGMEGVEVGMEVVLLGEGVSAEEVAGVVGTIAYEVLCGVRGERVLV